MQFVMDQDDPAGYVSRLKDTIAIAWKNYCRPLSDTCLYFPSRFFEAGVAARYVNSLTMSCRRKNVQVHQNVDLMLRFHLSFLCQTLLAAQLLL